MKKLEKSNLAKINEVIFSKDFDFERLIKKSSSIFSQEIESIIKLQDDYFELLKESDLKDKNKENIESKLLSFDWTSFVKTRLKSIVLVFSLNSNLVEVYKNDFYCKIINESLNNKSIMVTSINLKTILNNKEFDKIVDSSKEDRNKLLYKVFKDYFENQFSKIVTDKMMYLSKVINNFLTDQSFIYELNDLFIQNKLPLSILNNYELKHYIKLLITQSIKGTFFSTSIYQNLDDEKLEIDVKRLTMEVVSEFAKEGDLKNLQNGFAFAARHNLFEDNLSYLKMLKTIFELVCEYQNYESELLFITACSDTIKNLKVNNIEDAKDLLIFMIKKELFYYNSVFLKIILELAKRIGEYNQKIDINATILFFGENYIDFVNSLINFNIIEKINLTIYPDSVIKLFLDEQSTITNNFVELYKKEKIKFSLNEEAKKSFTGLLIGIENGLVISEKEFIEKEIRNFISLFE